MWDKEYDTDIYVYGKIANDFLRENYTSIPKNHGQAKVLCLAEGEGRNAVFLAQQGYQVTAVDLSAVGLKKARQLANDNHVSIETICADLAELDLGERCWDGIVSIFCHLPPTVRQALYRRVEKALKPTGVLLLESYRPEQLDYQTGGPPVAEMMTSTATLLKELPNLDFSHLVAIERNVVEGVNHKGLAAVVQAIATPISR